METSNQMNNNNSIQRNRNLSLLKHRHVKTKGKNKSKQHQLTTSKCKQATSMICVVLSLCQGPSGSRALVQSRTRPEMTNLCRLVQSASHPSVSVRVAPPRTSTITCTSRTSSCSSRSSHSYGQHRRSSLQYQNYQLCDNDDATNIHTGTSTGAKANHADALSDSLQDQQLQQPQQKQTQKQKQQHDSSESFGAAQGVIGPIAKQLQHSPSQTPHEHEHHNDHHISSFFHTLWTAGKTRRARELHDSQLKEDQQEQQEQQYVLDDYLESIDRRYKRLHDDDVQPSQKKNGGINPASGGFTSALQWLTQHNKHSDAVSESEAQRRQEDALYVLGLADLASTRLLQRHHLPVPKSTLNKSVVIDIDAYKAESEFTSGLKSPFDLVIGDANNNNNNNNHHLVSHECGHTHKHELSAIAMTSTATIHKVTTIIQMLRKLKLAFLRDVVVTTSSKLSKHTFDTARVGAKTFTHGLASFVSFLTNTSGGKQTLQAASMMVVAIFAFAVSIIHPVTKV